MKKSIFLFFAAILCATSAWAHTLAKDSRIWFAKPSDWTLATTQLFIGHGSWSQGYTMSKITNTNLYYKKMAKWDGYTHIGFMNADSEWEGKGENVESRFAWAPNKTSLYNKAVGTYAFFTPDMTYTSGTDHTIVNRKQSIIVQVKEGNGGYSNASKSPAAITLSTFELTSSQTAEAKKATISLNASTIDANVNAVYTAVATLSYTDVSSDYVFDGWYFSDGTKINGNTYTVDGEKTIYARFTKTTEENNKVEITYMCGSTSVATAVSEFVGVESEKSFTAPTVTGYQFKNWTVGAGMTLKVGTENDATITVVTKSASSDYTLVANYEEVLETVYFINTNKWARVNIHKWNGKAAASSWPGEKLTASGEKIGEYDIYSYTAKQGDYANVIFNSKTSSTDGGNAQTGDLEWTAGKYYIYNYGGKSDWYTKEEAEELLVVPVVEETVYFVNNKKWTKVQAYAWNSTGNNTWPGVALTATGEKVADYDVYSYTAPQGYVNIIFNNKTGDSGEQSADFVWKDGKYYCMGADANYAGGTQEDVETIIAEYALAANVYLAGEMTNPDNWDINKKAFKKATADATTATVTVALAAKTYKFKLVVDGAWKGNGGIMKRGENAVHEGGWSFDEDEDCQIVADIAGDYTFTWNLTDKKLTVAYPPLPKHQVTATVNPAETGEVTGTGEYEQGAEATLVATPAAGYAFQNWTKGGEVVSTEATYSFKVTKAVELVANFVPEVTHEVTVSYLCNDTPIPGQAETKLAVGVTTRSTISAPAITNYKFNSWTLGTGVQSEDATTANPIQITTLAEGEYTLVANYTKIELTYTVKVPEGTEKCYIAGGMNSWSFQEMTPTANANEFTITIDGATADHKYKYACGPDWAYVEKKADGSDLDADRTYNANDVVAKWADVITYVLMGVNGDWTTGIPMIKDGEQYVCKDVTIDGGDDAVKAITLTNGTATAWCGNVDSWSNAAYTADGDGNIVLEDGIYDFYFKVSDDKIYINQTGYVRNVTNKYGTICLPYASASTTGATFYRVAGKETGKVYLESVDALEAGVPYIFEKSASQIKVVYTGNKETTAGNANGLVGTFVETTVPDGDYILYNNAFCTNEPAGTLNKIRANRAYLNMDEVTGSKPTPMPGRRYIGMDVEGENEATGFENITAPADKAVKAIINGQLIIIRDGEMYNAMGVKL